MKAVRFPVRDGIPVKQGKAWNIAAIKFNLGAHRGMDATQELNDPALAALLRGAVFAHPPSEVWERIEENVSRMHLTQLTR
jgi:hypothetical protein